MEQVIIKFGKCRRVTVAPLSSEETEYKANEIKVVCAFGRLLYDLGVLRKRISPKGSYAVHSYRFYGGMSKLGDKPNLGVEAKNAKRALEHYVLGYFTYRGARSHLDQFPRAMSYTDEG